MNNEQMKELLLNDIKELKQNIILMKVMLRELRIFYIANKGKYDHTLTRPFFVNLQNFIEIEIIDIDMCHREYVKHIANHGIGNSGNSSSIVMADKSFTSMYCKIEEALMLKIIFKMVIKEKKIKCYEKLIKFYPDKTDIENILELYSDEPEIKNKQYSISPYIIFLIIILFYLTIVILLIMYFTINNKYNNLPQCIEPPLKNTQYINKHNKLKDLMII